MISCLLNLLEYINQMQKFMKCQLKNMAVNQKNICFLSSNTWDVSGGGVFGYNSVWVNRFNKVFDKLSYKPQFVINNLNGAA